MEVWWLIQQRQMVVACWSLACANFSLITLSLKAMHAQHISRTPVHTRTLSDLWSHYFCLCLAISAFALAALVLPGHYPYYLDLIHSLSVGPYLIGLAKLGIAFPVSYHTYNGIRHLVRLYHFIYRHSKCFLFPIQEYIWHSLVAVLSLV